MRPLARGTRFIFGKQLDNAAGCALTSFRRGKLDRFGNSDGMHDECPEGGIDRANCDARVKSDIPRARLFRAIEPRQTD